MKRVLAGLITSLLFMAAVLSGPRYFFPLWCVVFLLALWEALKIAGIRAYESALFMISGTAVFVILSLELSPHAVFPVLFVFFAGGILFALRSEQFERALERLSLGLFVTLYLTMLAYGFRLYTATGSLKFIYFFSFIWCYDTCAFYFGCAFGRHKISPIISPKKSWEGLLYGLTGTA
ncbi:MAG: phosphatidate cytidylyltransferase, partial [Candidatus Wallbacteria bacterium]|nr:phosphatidate cytidylyltransferase [Candidatus Wallbacteria bacterium]